MILAHCFVRKKLSSDPRNMMDSFDAVLFVVLLCARVFDNVQGNSVGVRPTKKRPLLASVNNAGFLASSEDEREDSRQGGILTCDNTGLYSNAKFEVGTRVCSTSMLYTLILFCFPDESYQIGVCCGWAMFLLLLPCCLQLQSIQKKMISQLLAINGSNFEFSSQFC